MSATTYRNLIRRREHQERSQPVARSKYGLLEKHKDYVQRAQNFHAKEKRLTDLRHRAAFRNPDEFYNKMVSSSTKDGIHRVESDRPSFTADELKLLKTQDTTYLQATKMMDDKKVERIRASLHLVGGIPMGIEVPTKAAEVLGLADRGGGSGGTRKGLKNAPPPKHTIFVESREEAEAIVGTERASMLFGASAKAAAKAGKGYEDDESDEGSRDAADASAFLGRKRRRAASHHKESDEEDDDEREDDDTDDDDEEEEEEEEDDDGADEERIPSRKKSSAAAPSASKRLALAQRGPALTFSDIAASSREEAAAEDAKATKKGGRASAPKKDTKLSGKDARKSKVALQASLNELAERAERSDKLGRLIQQISTERALLQKGRRVKVADATKTTGAVYKWRAQRKK